MSDILIKGMEMPKDKAVAVVIHPDGTAYSAEMFAGVCTEYLDDYTAVPVPPHGRLGDLDKQDVQIEALIERHLHGYTKSTWDFICELRDILKRNPTVIQKESAEEEKNDE